MKLLSIAAAALLLSSQAASAADVSAPAQTIDIAPSLESSFTFEYTFPSLAKDDTFTNRYDFTLAGDVYYIDAAVSSNSLDLKGFELFNASTNSSLAIAKDTSEGATEKWRLSVDELKAGSYYFLVRGTGMTPSPGASLAGNGVLEFQALPVPEPTTPAMLLGGLAVLAAVARRKAK